MKVTLKYIFLIALVLGCAASANAQTPEPEGYRVVAHEAKTHEWTIIKNGTFNGEFQAKKLVVRCLSFTDLDKFTFGPDVCDLHLQVGRFINPHPINRLDGNAPLPDVFEYGDGLVISEGTVNRHTTQVFSIKKIELLSHRP
jgi:hypothetical protein